MGFNRDDYPALNRIKEEDIEKLGEEEKQQLIKEASEEFKELTEFIKNTHKQVDEEMDDLESILSEISKRG